MDDLTGQVLDGRYRVGARIGRGGMGDVYEAVLVDRGRTVAIKVMADAADPRDAARFAVEAAAIAKLSDPHIVRVIEWVSKEGSPTFLVMERLRGESLRDRLARERPLPPETAVRIAEQVLKALVTAHGAGILHRDVKPANVFLVDEGKAKLLDFGIAKASSATTSRHTPRSARTTASVLRPTSPAPATPAAASAAKARRATASSAPATSGSFPGPPARPAAGTTTACSPTASRGVATRSVDALGKGA